jgi:chromosome segregation ATPase
LSEYEELKAEVAEMVKALEAASSAQLTESEQRLRFHLEKAISRIGELESKMARLGEIEAKVAKIAEIDARLAKLADLDVTLAKMGEFDRRVVHVISAMKHLKGVVDPLLQNWDNFFGSAPAAVAVQLGSFRAAVTALNTDIDHLEK